MYTVPGGRATYGHTIGIIMQDDGLIRLPGDVGNLTTYRFPVTYRVVGDFPMSVIQTPRLFDHAGAFVEAARDLEAAGCKAITGGCGYLALLQPILSEAVQVPVFASSLIQVPLIAAMLRKDQKVGILTTNSTTLTERHFNAVGWSSREVPIAVAGIEEDYHGDFSRHQLVDFYEDPTVFPRMEAALVRLARRLVAEQPAVGAILLECTNMPPFADAVQRAVNRPVFDAVTLINMVHDAVTRKTYRGSF